MIVSNFKPDVTNLKVREIVTSLKSPWSDDVWLLSSQVFREYGKIEEKGATKNSTIRFNSLPNLVSLEAKYFLFHGLSNYRFSIRTIYTYGQTFKRLGRFLEKHYFNINSFIDIPFEKALSKYKFFLRQERISSIKANIHFFTTFFEFLYDFYDMRDEFDKDIWDVRNIPHASVEINYSRFKLNFESIHKKFRTVVKQYCWYSLTFKSSGRIYNADLVGIKCFFNFISTHFGHWNDLSALSRKDFEKFLVFFHTRFRNCTDSTKHPYISGVKLFLEYLQKNELPIGPTKPILSIIFPEDIPPKKRNLNENEIKYIPEDILNQLQNLLNYDPSKLIPKMTGKELEYVPIIVLLIATGWRISDILNLRYDNCLIVINSEKYYLQGDINKTKVNNHRVPVDKDVAMVLQTVIESTKAKSNDQNNPNHFLFVRTRGKRMGRPFATTSVQRNLNNWAFRYNIVDSKGEVFHFRNHAFRHSKGVELINLGMNLTHIMKWFAHASPEMTLTYAKLADDTLRKEWEKAIKKKGPLLKVNISQGTVQEIKLDDDLIHWEYIKSNIEAAKVPLGYCMASKKEGCPFVITPCLDSCPNFCTTPEHIPEFEKEIQNVKEVIERTKDMPIFNGKNQKQLENLNRIRDLLSNGASYNGVNAKKVLLDAKISKENFTHES
ncbi:tyrosine-type recombinase/integrase [Bacillus thuringiensis]